MIRNAKPLDPVYGRLTVIGRSGHHAICRCECGTVREVETSKLRSGASKSCGCLARELTRTRQTGVGKHLMSLTTEHRIWVKMKNRCLNPDNDGYANYGGRGITVCDRWLESFENFYADMGPRPSMKYTLDRRDNDGPYAPENCRWATTAEQLRNTRRNRKLAAFGEEKTVVDWALDPRCAVTENTLRSRIRRGFDAVSAISLPALDTTNNLSGGYRGACKEAKR